MIGLVDGNNFYVSCERVFDPKLEGKPVAVLSNNDGCVISRSYEFKALKIPMGEPYFKLKPLADAGHVFFRSSNYELYGDLSRRVIQTLHEFTPDVEQYSIDEAFIHLSSASNDDWQALGRRVRETVLKWVGIPCGVGFAPTKTLAKIANHIGKKLPTGVFVMPKDPKGLLADLPVDEVWGVGRRLAMKLRTWGVRSAGALATADEKWLRQKGNITLVKTARELRGIPQFAHEDPDERSQSISCSRSYGKAVTAFDDISESICFFISRAAEKLRKEGHRAAGVNVYLQFYPEYQPQFSEGGYTATTISFSQPLAYVGDMMKEIRPHLPSLFLEGRRYKKAGVIFFGLEAEQGRQLTLFADVEREKKTDRISAVLDQLNQKFGRGTVFSLGEGIERGWAMKRDFLSPHYTTKWDELPRAH